MPELLEQPRERSGWNLGSSQVDGEGLKVLQDGFLKGFVMLSSKRASLLSQMSSVLGFFNLGCGGSRAMHKAQV